MTECANCPFKSLPLAPALPRCQNVYSDNYSRPCANVSRCQQSPKWQEDLAKLRTR